MEKNSYYSVKSSKGKNDEIAFNKTNNGLINIYLGCSEANFTVKECREIINKLVKCLSE